MPSNRLACATTVGALWVVLLTGCPSMPLTQPVQTLHEGQTQSYIGFEWFGVGTPATSTTSSSFDSVPFALPYYGMRVGAAKNLDFGFRVHTSSTLGFDVKLQLLDTEGIAVALDPTVEYAWVWGYGYLPLMVGINLGDAVQIILSGRVGYQVSLVSDPSASPFDTSLGSTQPLAGGGIGLYLRAGDSLGVTPEVQLLRGFGNTHPTIISVALAFTLGDQVHRPGDEAPTTPPAAPLTAYPAAPAAPASPATGLPPPGPGAAPGGPPPDVAPEAPPGYGGPATGASPTGAVPPPPPPPR